MCYVTIFDGSGKPITVEVSREIYQVFADYEREMERQRKEEYRHRLFCIYFSATRVFQFCSLCREMRTAHQGL